MVFYLFLSYTHIMAALVEQTTWFHFHRTTSSKHNQPDCAFSYSSFFCLVLATFSINFLRVSLSTLFATFIVNFRHRTKQIYTYTFFLSILYMHIRKYKFWIKNCLNWLVIIHASWRDFLLAQKFREIIFFSILEIEWHKILFVFQRTANRSHCRPATACNTSIQQKHFTFISTR